MNPNQYCQQLVQRHSSAFRYSLLGLALPQRQALTALQAFCVQTTRIPQECQELANAHSKLDWWRSEVERLFANAPQHPVSKALHPYLATYNLQEEYFREMLDGVAMDLEYDLYPSFSALTLYLHRRGSVPALLAAEISGYQEQRATLRFAHEAGMLLQLFALLCQTRSAAQQGHCYLPEDEMQRCGVDLSDLLAARTTDRVRQLFILQGQRIQHCYPQATIHGLEGRVEGADQSYSTFGDTLRGLYQQDTPIIALCAAGIVIRSLASLLSNALLHERLAQGRQRIHHVAELFQALDELELR